MKYEIKVEIDDKEKLNNIIQESYFDNGSSEGKLIKKKSLPISNNDPLYMVFKGLENMTVRVSCPDIIDGHMRFVIDESNGDINLIPCSIYCIVEDNKYSFY